MLLIAYVIIPEKEFKEVRREGTQYIAKEMNINPRLANFIANTKTGRKLAYILGKRKIKKQLKEKNTKDNKSKE